MAGAGGAGIGGGVEIDGKNVTVMVMNVFKSFTLRWWQGSLFKFSMVALGIVLGATWPEIFRAWCSALLVVFALPAAYLSWVWWKQ